MAAHAAGVMPATGTDRIADIVAVLTRLAGGDLGVRGTTSGADDELDAVMVGINMLAEDLEAGRAEIEQRVLDRTAELRQLNGDILHLTELSNLLQACSDREEAYAVIAQGVAPLFHGISGAAYLFNASRNVLELKVSWGDAGHEGRVHRDECWALRRGQRHVVQFDAPALSCRHVLQRTGDSVCIPMSAHGETIGILHLMAAKPTPAPERVLTETKQRLGVAVAEQTALSLSNLELRETLRLQAMRDPLTGLYNRRFAEDWLDREVSHAEGSGATFGVVMADVDHFKRFNDVHGHDVGDRVLVAVANAIRSALRTGDVVCRYGGEEFLVLVSGVDEETLAVRAEQVRTSVAHLAVQHQGVGLPAVTMSAGTALHPCHGDTAGEVIKAADDALYAAKLAGRNCVVRASALAR